MNKHNIAIGLYIEGQQMWLLPNSLNLNISPLPKEIQFTLNKKRYREYDILKIGDEVFVEAINTDIKDFIMKETMQIVKIVERLNTSWTVARIEVDIMLRELSKK